MDIRPDSFNVHPREISESSENELDIVHDKKTKNNRGPITKSAENVDETVAGGKLISSQDSSSSVVILSRRGSRSSGEHSASVEFLNVPDDTGEYAASIDAKKGENEAVASQSSTPPAPSLEKKKKGEGVKKFVEKAAQKAKAAVDQVKAAKGKRDTTKVTEAVENYFNEYRDTMFDKTNSAYRAYFKLLDFDIDEFVNPGKELGGFKKYVTQYVTDLILEKKIKKSDLDPENLNRILTDAINKKVDFQKDDKIKGKVALNKLINKE